MEHNYLIAGQGLAGSMCGWFALEKGEKPLVIDPGHTGSASKVAGGMVNPVTGKRMVKTWNAETLLPFARRTYRAIENTLNVSLYHEMNLVKLFKSVQQQNDWLAKSGEPDYQDWVASDTIPEYFHSLFNIPYGGVEIRGSGYLEVAEFLDHFRQYLKQKDLLIEDQVQWEAVVQEENHVAYKDLKADVMIDCTGFDSLSNPWFNNLPFSPVKGEVLTFKASDLAKVDKLVNKGVWILPIGHDQFKIGATYDHQNLDRQPTRQGREVLEGHLKNDLKVPYEIIDHQAGIRPATFDVRPYVGFHSEYSRIGILNGFGTKGVSLAPLLAWQLLNHSEENSTISPEVNISRYLER